MLTLACAGLALLIVLLVLALVWYSRRRAAASAAAKEAALLTPRLPDHAYLNRSASAAGSKAKAKGKRSGEPTEALLATSDSGSSSSCISQGPLPFHTPSPPAFTSPALPWQAT